MNRHTRIRRFATRSHGCGNRATEAGASERESPQHHQLTDFLRSSSFSCSSPLTSTRLRPRSREATRVAYVISRRRERAESGRRYHVPGGGHCLSLGALPGMRWSFALHLDAGSVFVLSCTVPLNNSILLYFNFNLFSFFIMPVVAGPPQAHGPNTFEKSKSQTIRSTSGPMLQASMSMC